MNQAPPVGVSGDGQIRDGLLVALPQFGSRVFGYLAVRRTSRHYTTERCIVTLPLSLFLPISKTSAMAYMNSTNSTCVFDNALHRVTDPSYNWTRANEEYRDGARNEALARLLATSVGKSAVRLPGCFYLGTMDETAVQECEKGGGMALLISITKRLLDADVWFCGIPGESALIQAPNPATDTDLNKIQMYVPGNPIICNLPSQNAASHRASFSQWMPLIAIGITSLVVLSLS